MPGKLGKPGNPGKGIGGIWGGCDDCAGFDVALDGMGGGAPLGVDVGGGTLGMGTPGGGGSDGGGSDVFGGIGCGGIFGGIEGGGTLGGGTPGGGMPMLGGGSEPWPRGATLGILGGIIGGGSETEDESNSLLMSSSVLIMVPGCLTMYPAVLFISTFPLPNTEPYCVALEPYETFFGATCSVFCLLVLPREFLNRIASCFIVLSSINWYGVSGLLHLRHF